MTTTKAEKEQDLEHALSILEDAKEYLTSPNGVLIISAELGRSMTDYFRAVVQEPNKPYISHLTWALAKVLGYSLRDRQGRWFLAISGYGYSKPDEIARHLARHYGAERIRYEVL